MTFKDFLTESEETKNVQALIRKLPAGHRKLVQGYKFTFQAGNTLKGDDGHVGLVHQGKITVAAPWNYGREFTTLHEIAHLVWAKFMKPKLKKEWHKIVKETKKDMQKSSALNQNDEELFCMTYAAAYTKHSPTTYMNKDRLAFIARLPK